MVKFIGDIGHLWVAFKSRDSKILLDTRGNSIYMTKKEAMQLRGVLDNFIGDVKYEKLQKLFIDMSDLVSRNNTRPKEVIIKEYNKLIGENK